MRSLHEFLTESKKSYEYRIKYVGDFTKEKQDILKNILAKFNPQSYGAIKTSPVMKCPYDFPNYENESVSSMDVVLEYPASTSQIIELASTKGCDINRLKIMDKRFADSVNAEDAAKEHEGALLDDAELPAQTPEQKEASEAYGNSFQDVVNSMEKRKYEFEKGTDTATAGIMDNK
jgi:hypothetical protein